MKGFNMRAASISLLATVSLTLGVVKFKPEIPYCVFFLTYGSLAENSITWKGFRLIKLSVYLFLGCDVWQLWSTGCPVMIIVENGRTFWQSVLCCHLPGVGRWFSPWLHSSLVIGSALAPLCTCFSQCCYLCHKPCRVPFLTSLYCLPQSYNPLPQQLYTGSWWYTQLKTSFLTKHEASELCSTMEPNKLNKLAVNCPGVSQSFFLLQLIPASVSMKS